MSVILHIAAAIEIIAGILVFAGSQSAIHEILGVLLVGFGIMTMGLGSILEALKHR